MYSSKKKKLNNNYEHNTKQYTKFPNPKSHPNSLLELLSFQTNLILKRDTEAKLLSTNNSVYWKLVLTILPLYNLA